MRDSAGHLAISLKRRRWITAGLLLGMSLGALEATVRQHGNADGDLDAGRSGALQLVFSAYLLTSTACVPIWGRLSDQYGRRRIYLTGVAIFILGSLLCGASTSMLQLILSRAVQGLGAGCIIPLSMTIVGELYTLAERPRTQAVFSGYGGWHRLPDRWWWVHHRLSDWRWVFS